MIKKKRVVEIIYNFAYLWLLLPPQSRLYVLQTWGCERDLLIAISSLTFSAEMRYLALSLLSLFSHLSPQHFMSCQGSLHKGIIWRVRYLEAVTMLNVFSISQVAEVRTMLRTLQRVEKILGWHIDWLMSSFQSFRSDRATFSGSKDHTV